MHRRGGNSPIPLWWYVGGGLACLMFILFIWNMPKGSGEAYAHGDRKVIEFTCYNSVLQQERTGKLSVHANSDPAAIVLSLTQECNLEAPLRLTHLSTRMMYVVDQHLPGGKYEVTSSKDLSPPRKLPEHLPDSRGVPPTQPAPPTFQQQPNLPRLNNFKPTLQSPPGLAAKGPPPKTAVSGPSTCNDPSHYRPQSSHELFRRDATDLLNRTIINEMLKFRKINPSWRVPYTDALPKNELIFFMTDMSRPDMGEDIIKYILQFEQEVMMLFARLLQKDPCQPNVYGDGWQGVSCETRFGTYQPIVLDIGANAGFYGLFSASLGWEVISIEPQPHCHQWIEGAAVLNGFSDRYWQINALAGNPKKKGDTVKIPQRTGCWGTWPYETQAQAWVAKEMFNQTLPDLEIPYVGVDELLLDTNYIVPFMKVDTEGYERHVLESASQMIAQGRILNIFVELGYYMWPKAGETHLAIELMMLRLMEEVGYKCKCYCLGTWDRSSWNTPQQISDILQVGVDIVTTECWLHLPDDKVPWMKK